MMEYQEKCGVKTMKYQEKRGVVMMEYYEKRGVRMMEYSEKCGAYLARVHSNVLLCPMQPAVDQPRQGFYIQLDVM